MEIKLEAPTKKVRGTRAEQRRNTRAALVAAGRALALEGNFQSASVDEITNLANLSRPSYYLHFKSKDELLNAVLEDQLEHYKRKFSVLTPKIFSKRSNVITWIKSFVQHMRDSGNLNSLYFPSDTGSKRQSMAHETRKSVITVLGHRLPQLRLIREDGSIDADRALKALLFLHQLEQAVGIILLADPEFDEQVLVDEVADRFLDLKN